MLRIIENDPWLSPYQAAIEGRHDHALWRESELTGGKMSLADFACDAKDARYEALWNGKYVGMDRTAKKVIYLDDTGVLHSFSYGK